MSKGKRLKRALISVLLVIALTLFGGYIYISDYYPADNEAISAFSYGSEVTVTTLYDGAIAYGDTDASIGFIFYPGGKVEYIAYEPLMRAIAAQGVLCILLEMPFNLAVLDVNAADGIKEEFSAVENWYIGGHSLGGSMAASYLASHIGEFSGLILLGSYSTADLSGADIRVFSLFGSADGVMNREKYEKYKSNLPQGFSEIEVEGANHAGFGMYGEQKGDGEALLTPTEEILIYAEKITDFINNK